VDDFTGAGYLPLFTDSLAAPQWRTVAGALPTSRHGSVLPVTLNQWESAKGVALTKVATTTALGGVIAGAALDEGDVITATVTAVDGGAVAGQVRFQIGAATLDAPVLKVGDAYVAEATVPASTEPGAEIAFAAAYQPFDVLAGSASAIVTATVGDPAASLNVTAVAGSRCVAGKIVQTVTVTNAESFPVIMTARSEYGNKSFGAVAAGKSASAAFTTRMVSIGAGTVFVTANATVSGESVTVTQPVGYAAASCD
jgi:hypothetical protein